MQVALQTLRKRALEPLLVHQDRNFAALAGWSMPSSTSLWDILKKSQIEGHDARQIRDIWQEFHSDPMKQRISTVLTGPQYLKFIETANRNPMFILPIFRGPNSFENFTLQCQAPYVLFTSLEDFKLNGSSAAPHMIVTHYTELLDSKGIVLVRGDILQPHALDAISAISLMSNCHEFYSNSGQKGNFVHQFNHRQQEFDFKKMLDSMGHDTSQLFR